MQQCSEGISCVQEAGTAGPSAGSNDTVFARIPKGNLIDFGRIMGHDLSFQP